VSDDEAWLPPSGQAETEHGAPPNEEPVAVPGYGPPPSAPEAWPAPEVPGYGPPPEVAPADPSAGGSAYRTGRPEPGWVPPPAPGLIPLHPLGFGTLLGTPFRELRRNPRPVIGTALIVQAIVMIVSVIATGAVGLHAYDRVMMAAPADRATVLSGAVAGFLLSLLIPVALGLVGSAFLQGVIVADVARGTLGEKLTLRGLWRAARGRLGPLVGWVALLTAGIVVLVLSVAAIAVGALLTGQAVWIASGIALAIVSGLGAVALGVWLYIKLSLVPSVIVMESAGVRRAMARSWSLTGGFFWRVFGIQALIAVIVNAISQIATTPLGLGIGIVGGLVAPTGTSGALDAGKARTLIVVLYGITLLLTLLVSALTTVVQSAAVALLYIDLRMRKEGLDLRLARYVEERQTGRREAPNPYGSPAPPSDPAGGPA
jgi:hypothetical protein